MGHFLDHKGRKGLKGSGIDHADDAILEVNRVEIQQEAKGDIAQLKIGKQLRFVNWGELGYCPEPSPPPCASTER